MCVTAGTGTAISPWLDDVTPDPRDTTPALTLLVPIRWNAAQTPTTSAIESSAPTSWKWTVSTGTSWTYASASASRANTAEALSRTGVGSSAEARRSRMLRHVRCGGSSTSTRTVILSARSPALVTVSVSSLTASGTTVSIDRKSTRLNSSHANISYA